MQSSSTPDYTQQLQEIMQVRNISSCKQLAQLSGVTEQQIQDLRQGKIMTMRVDILCNLSQALNLSIIQLLVMFSDASIAAYLPQKEESATLTSLKSEYQHLQQQFDQQRTVLQQEFQQNVIESLETWMLQWPNAIYAVQNNPNLPAERLLPLVHPLEQLLKDWEVDMIGCVGSQMPYNPQYHQLLAGDPKPGDPVKVRCVGYQKQGKLLHRAKVEAV